jgi:alcohol dehydrogenase
VCCALCSSDLHTHAGRRPGPTPAVLGHEVLGRVEALGPAASRRDCRGASLTVGDRVTWSVAASCGHCFFCADGLPQKCERLYKYGHEPWTPDRPFNGGLADFILLTAGTALVRIPEELPDRLATAANCATATAAAVLRCGLGGRTSRPNVLIFGAGVLGLTACAMARTAGVETVLVSEPDRARRERAAAFGATRLLSADPDELAAGVAAATQGRGADVVLELAGAASAVQAGLGLARVGGTVVLAGTVLPTAAVALDPEQMVRRMLTLRGVHNYTPADLAAAVDFLAGPGRMVPFAALLGETFPLAEVERAFAYAHAHPGMRVVVVP